MAESLQSTLANSSREPQAPLVTDPTKQPTQDVSAGDMSTTDERARKRDFFRFGRKEDEKKKTKMAGSETTSPGGLRPVSPLAGLDATRSAGSPSRNHPYGIAASPRGLRSASPRTHSPASSMIFERSVQEDVSIPQASPQIPSHIITENHIPPALDATSQAITDKRLDPDIVEIVTHAAHQPAAVTITEAQQPVSPILSEELLSSSGHIPRSEPLSEAAPSYANLDSVDVRRLSFISFADVVHGEHDLQDTRRDSAALASFTNLNAQAARSPSPMRSPGASSAAMGTSPPTSVSAHDASPQRGPSDLNIETMRQALRKTHSGDLSGFRSAPLSPTGHDDGVADRPLR